MQTIDSGEYPNIQGLDNKWDYKTSEDFQKKSFFASEALFLK